MGRERTEDGGRRTEDGRRRAEDGRTESVLCSLSSIEQGESKSILGVPKTRSHLVFKEPGFAGNERETEYGRRRDGMGLPASVDCLLSSVKQAASFYPADIIP